jgi:hypothetical protein
MKNKSKYYYEKCAGGNSCDKCRFKHNWSCADIGFRPIRLIDKLKWLWQFGHL